MHNLQSSTNNYYEAILQLRPLDKKLIDYVANQLKKEPKVTISKIIEKDFGMDLYLSSRQFALNMGRKLKKVFKGKTKISRKLFKTDRLTSRAVYRVTVCFRLDKIEG